MRRKLLLGGASALLAAFAAELAFRAMRPDPRESSVAATGDQYRFYQFDPRLGWANAPGAHGTFERGEFRYAISVNAHGMRQGEVESAKPIGRRRIALIGDSFVWGIGVADADRVSERMAGRLGDTDVLNFGVSGYGPVQYLLELDHVLRFSPDLVVVCFCLGNDFVDDVQYVRYGYYKPFARLDDAGELRIEGWPLPNTKAFGFAPRGRWLGSELLGALRDRLDAQRARAGQRGLALLDEAAMYDAAASGELGEQRAEAIAIDRRLLAAIAERVRGAGAELLVVPAPTKFEYGLAGGTDAHGRCHLLEDVLLANCRALGIESFPTVDLLSAEDFWRDDGHWNVEGHRKLAEAIAEHLATRAFAAPR